MIKQNVFEFETKGNRPRWRKALDKMLLNLDDSLLATNAKVKGVPSSCIDDDDPKRGKKQMELEGGCIDIRNHEELVNHSVIVNSAKNGIDGSTCSITVISQKPKMILFKLNIVRKGFYKLL